MKNISVFGFATFGHPNGFTQSLISGDPSLEKKVDTFDLKTEAILLLSASDRIYGLRKEDVNKDALFSYSVYTFAKEKNSNRSGTFIGTAIIFKNEITEENLTVGALHSIHAALKNNNVSGQELQVKHSQEFNVKDLLQKDFEKMEFHTRKVALLNGQNLSRSLVIYSPTLEQATIQQLFKKSLEFINDYKAIYIIDSPEVAEYVQKRRIFKLIQADQLEDEIQSLNAERAKKNQVVLRKIEQEKEKVAQDKKDFITHQQKLIAEQEKKHAENRGEIDLAHQNLNKGAEVFQEYYTQLEILQRQVKSNTEVAPEDHLLKEAQKKFEQKRKTFNKGKSQIRSLQPAGSSTFPAENRAEPLENKSNKPNEPRKPKLDVFKLCSAIINVLLLGALGYFVYTQYSNKTSAEVLPSSSSFVPLEDTIKIQSMLNPLPNNVLAAQDLKRTVAKLSGEMSLDSVVNLIFQENRAVVGQVYRYQELDYGKILLEKNPNAFKYTAASSIAISAKDSLKIIPAFTEKKIP